VVVNEYLSAAAAALPMDAAMSVRAIRLSEMSLFEKVRETFKQRASDYEVNHQTARTFFATATDTFHFAASEKTAVQIILARANALKPNMGLVAIGNRRPTAEDVVVAKNYCTADELRKMEVIGESWLLFAEAMAMQGKQVTMATLLAKLKALIAFQEFPVFGGYGGHTASRAQADRHARAQLRLFNDSFLSDV
jgi:hypothetical protein